MLSVGVLAVAHSVKLKQGNSTDAPLLHLSAGVSKSFKRRAGVGVTAFPDNALKDNILG